MLFHLSQQNKLILNVPQAKADLLSLTITGVMLKGAVLAFDNLNQDHKKYYDDHCQYQWDYFICPAKSAVIHVGDVFSNVLKTSGGVVGVCVIIGLIKLKRGIYNAKNNHH